MKTRVREILAAVAVAALVSGCAPRQFERVGLHPEWATPVEMPGVSNLYCVSAELYRGAQPEEDGWPLLKEMGITTVVNLRTTHFERGEVTRAGLAYEQIFFRAWHPEEEDMVRFLQIVTDRARTPVFVHCLWGADRTGLKCAVYRIAVQGWSKQEAVAEMTQGGFGYNTASDDYVEFIEELDVARLKKDAGLP